MEFLEVNLTQVEAAAKAGTDPTLTLNQLKYSLLVLLYVTFRDVVKYFVPIIVNSITKKIDPSLKLE
jgi:hypothetical protein